MQKKKKFPECSPSCIAKRVMWSTMFPLGTLRMALNDHGVNGRRLLIDSGWDWLWCQCARSIHYGRDNYCRLMTMPFGWLIEPASQWMASVHATLSAPFRFPFPWRWQCQYHHHHHPIDECASRPTLLACPPSNGFDVTIWMITNQWSPWLYRQAHPNLQGSDPVSNDRAMCTGLAKPSALSRENRA